MSSQEPSTSPALTSLPRLEDLPRKGDGYDAERVADAFESFRRHSAQLQAQLRVLQAASRGGAPSTEPSGHAVRMDALHLIRAASEFADTVESDAQKASQTQMQKAEGEIRRRNRELQEREAEVDRYRQESERQRAEMLNNTRNEVRELLANANRDATQELTESEARGNRLLEQSRHQATELTNAARAEVEQTLEWARAQAGAILARAQHGAEQLLAAAGLGQDAISHVAQAIVDAAERSTGEQRPQPTAAIAAPQAAPQPEEEAPPPPAPAPPPTAAGAPEPDRDAGDEGSGPEGTDSES